jgi:NAD(P)-dependent dehydrogenase (short-subunit alcohol dehydrogenase family)
MGMFEGRHAVVTGGGSGIGLATSRRLAEEGARVAVLDISAEAGERAAAELGGTYLRADVSDPREVARVFAAAADALGGLDIVHLNAGITTGEGDLAKLTDEQYERIRGINLDGVVYGVREAVRLMEPAGGGAIVATASLAGMVAYEQDPIYALTKHGVVGLVRGYGLALAPRGITLNAVCPGIVDTPLVGDARQVLRDAGFPMLRPEDIAEAVVRAVTGGRSGECWVCQPGRDALVYEFKGVPGPRVEGAEGMAPPSFR